MVKGQGKTTINVMKSTRESLKQFKPKRVSWDEFFQVIMVKAKKYENIAQLVYGPTDLIIMSGKE